MAEQRRRAVLRPDDRAAIAALREALDRAAYTTAGVRDALGAADDTLELAESDRPFLLRRLAGSPLGALLRLFLVGVALPVAEARTALAPLSLDAAAALGILAFGRERAHGLIHLAPAGELRIASDPERPGAALPPDHVVGVGAAAELLARLTIRRPVERALDLGTGCGYHALLAAAHAGTVVATDVNPRALAFTSLNAALNGITNVETRLGDWLEPVRGETFDLIVCNPPFVISPDATLVYRESPLGGDRVCRMLVESVPSHLREGGLAHLLANWGHPAGEDWSGSPRAWVAGRGVDAWLIQAWTRDPRAYAVLWNQSAAGDRAHFVAAVDRWVAHLEARAIGAVSYGAVILRRRAGAGRVRTDELTEMPTASVSADLDRLLALDDRLADLGDDALLELRIEVAPDVRLDQAFRWDGARFALTETTLALDHGLQPRAELDPSIVRLLSLADGTRSVGEIVAVMAADSDVPEVLRASALTMVRRLLGYGFLRLG